MAPESPIVAPPLVTAPQWPAACYAPNGWGRERPLTRLFSTTLTAFFSNFSWIWGLIAFLGVFHLAWHFIGMFTLGDGTAAWQQNLVGKAFVGSGSVTAVLTWGFSIVLGTALNVMLSSGMYASLAARGRGERVNPQGSVQLGLGAFVTCFCTTLWIGIRLIPWFLLFIIPGIVKAYAWSLALPARLSGDVEDAESAISLSAEMTEGRKLYIFGYFLLLAIAAGGLGASLAGVTLLSHAAGGPDVSQPITALTILIQLLVGVVNAVGTWLLYADAVAPRRPSSPAATSAEDPWQRPYVLPREMP